METVSYGVNAQAERQRLPDDLAALCFRAIESRLAGKSVVEQTPEQPPAFTGDPVPLIKWQWPALVVPPGSNDADLFPRGVRLDDWQIDIIRAMLADDICQIRIKGAAGVGKGYAVAMGVCLYYREHADAKIVITSASADHAESVMFAEIKRWFATMRSPGAGRMLSDTITADPHAYIKIANPKNGEGFSGHHSAHVMFVIDEATHLPESRFNLVATQAHKIVALANPRVVSGWFRREFGKVRPDQTRTEQTPMGGLRLVTVAGMDCTNVKTGRVVIPGQLDLGRYKLLKSGDPRFAMVFADGQFPPEDEFAQLILPSWFERHRAAWRCDLPIEAGGLDVAGSDEGDKTVLAVGGRLGVRKLYDWREVDTMLTVGRVLHIFANDFGIDLTHGNHPFGVDVVGLGKGTADRLKELGVWVVFVNNGEGATDSKRYTNKRAENYGELARRLDPKEAAGAEPFGLPDEPFLLEELAAPEKTYRSDGIKFSITPKDRKPGMPENVKVLSEILGRSPDSADAVVNLYAAVRANGLAGEFVYLEQVVQ